MQKERSAGIVIFRKEGGERYYLLLRYGKGHRTQKPYWDFSKGHIEEGEDELQAASREAKEETGLTDVSVSDGFKEKIRYYFVFRGNRISKTVTFFVGETKSKEVNISSEHIGFQWLSFENALESLSFRNAKNILRKSEVFLSKNKV
jgi:8-oxo-dGTP pyrophosphatase MutT (NUDIX family)